MGENPWTAPGLGTTPQQQAVNRFYHRLCPRKEADQYTQTLWEEAIKGSLGPPSASSLPFRLEKDFGFPACDLLAPGRYLHNFQDSFSHAGFEDDTWGHTTGGHSVDHTISDLIKSEVMAVRTLAQMVKWAQSCRACCFQQKMKDLPPGALLDENLRDRLKRFLNARGGDFASPIDKENLKKKTCILDVPMREQDIPPPAENIAYP